MVTTSGAGGASGLQRLLLTKTWDLQDPSKRDSWLLRTTSALEADDMLTALNEGPPLPESLILRNQGMTLRQAEKLSGELMDDFVTANQKGYRVLLERIDVEKRPTLAKRIAHYAKNRDGHGVWQLVKKACGFSSGARQDTIVDAYNDFALSSATPAPDKLSDDLHDLHGVWDMLADENGTKSYPALYRRALRLLPQAQGYEAFAGVVRGFVALNDKSPVPIFEDYDGFVETIVEQYRGVYKAMKGRGGPPLLGCGLRCILLGFADHPRDRADAQRGSRRRRGTASHTDL